MQIWTLKTCNKDVLKTIKTSSSLRFGQLIDFVVERIVRAFLSPSLYSGA